MLKPDLAILDETDSGLDVDAVRTVSKGIEEFQKNQQGSLLVITTDTVITHREELLHIAESKSSPDEKERKIRKRYPEEFRFIWDRRFF